MNIEKIGQAAGEVWQTLNTKGAMSAEDLKRSTRFTDYKLYTAIGWLAREGKLKFENETIALV